MILRTTPVTRLNRRQIIGGLGALTVAGCAVRPPANAVDVVIIGAGLAGLTAAERLQRDGAKVVVLEATDRVGGRMYTARDLPDRGEYGGIQIGDTYIEMRALAERHGIAIDAFPHRFPPPVYAVGETLVAPADWATSPANPLGDDLRSVVPSRLLGHVLAPHNPLQTVTDWADPRFVEHDQSIASQLLTHGAAGPALELIRVNANYNSLAEVSAINVWRGQLLRRQASRADVIPAGSDALPNAVAEALGGAVVLETPVARISAGSRSRGVETTRGDQWRADHVIDTAPPAAAAGIALDVDGGSQRQAALQTLPYTAITQLFIDTPPFWEVDGLPPHLWTDGRFERWFPRIDATSGDIVGFKVWLNGAGALRAEQGSEAAIIAAVQRTLATLRPASNGEATLARRFSWQSGMAYQNGAYPEWPAGNTAALANELRRPLGRVHFAGDYTAARMTGMEAAVESGVRAANAVLAVA
ncbi:MAG: NAD(P)/FAD-dependent oxidoreductase [Pseudomonadota bacterium]